jgi:hypothetical protein
MRLFSTAYIILPLVALALFPGHARSQTPATDFSFHEHLISGSPLSLLAGWFNGEYERRLSDRNSVGIAGGWLDLDEDDYTFVAGFLRYYPRGNAFQGFFIGGRGGFFRVDDGEKESTPIGLGLEVGYGWLVGPGDSVYFGLGIGLTHLFGGDLDHAAATIPAVRLVNVGIAF